MAVAQRKYRVIGRRVPKVDGLDKVTGRAVFGADVRLPGLLVGAVLRSPHAHARIRRIDTSGAEALPGVAAVVTGRDLPTLVPSAQGAWGTVTAAERFLSEEVIARDRVLFHGHPVAAVAAVSRHVAEEALALIEVEYEVLPHVLDPLKAMEPGAVILHPGLRGDTDSGGPPGNVADKLHVSRGSVEAGFAEADVVVERSFRTQVVHQGYIEPDAETAHAREDGTLVVWADSQGIHTHRLELAQVLGLPVSRIKVIPTEVGGGFGGKAAVRVSPLCAALSRKAGAPVQIALGRDEVLRATGPGNATVSTVKLGMRRDGTITALQARVVFDIGAYPGGLLVSSIRRVFSHYRTPNLRVDALNVVTNKPHLSAYRAPGGTPVAFALESSVDEAADALGMDPLEFRLRNASRKGDPTPDGAALSSVGLVALLERVREHPCWTTPLAESGRGRGLALGMWTMPSGTMSCQVSLAADGSVTLVLGTVDLSATRTSLAMVAAECLGLELDAVRVVVGDTDTATYSDDSSADKVTYITSKAVQRAVEDLVARLKGRVAEQFGVAPEHVGYGSGRFYLEGADEKAVGLADLAAGSIRRDGPVVGHGAASEETGATAIAPSGAVHVAEVEVDRETGKVRLLRYTAFQDAGLAIAPDQVEGQMQGGAVQGIGWALSEAYDFDEAGALRNATLLDYRMPTCADVPFVDTNVMENPSDDHPLGVRAAGQVPIVPPPAAIANAIRRAAGVRLYELPMTPERVLAALRKAAT